MQPRGASKKRDDQAIFSKDGPNLIKPALTNNPKVIPKIYKLKKSKNKGGNNFANFHWSNKKIGEISTPNFF